MKKLLIIAALACVLCLSGCLGLGWGGGGANPYYYGGGGGMYQGYEGSYLGGGGGQEYHASNFDLGRGTVLGGMQGSERSRHDR
jgi:hypothetical protein